MDITTLRSIATVLALFAIIAIIVWTLGKSKKGLEEAANLPFADDDDIPSKKPVEKNTHE
ncbi:cbb3-type cytochrome c oxidase subunit 3 [Marinomonas sp. 15G1-11]|uniref:Cbb3-type cytochrome c oxidase subunit 3 n=1 Tax=Marinomonas phaeophyticola TaxID=3004091 RepID=A0ABT4JR71_9GAMM|nr:cbb3-type cytochrome c oxidase subunit 3 [Marinomonas sp. 15G1-11]MCZ2720318.1 cbb3-type cytochrome c oxidase subunit 3 [Marinomonas sp. 15G1-11]